MKNSVFASLFFEAINNAGEDNSMAKSVSGMLNQIEQKAIKKNPNTSGQKKEQKIKLHTSNNLKPIGTNKIKVIDTTSSKFSPKFSDPSKKTEYQKIGSERPYYFLSLESLIEKKKETKSTFSREKLKTSRHGKLSVQPNFEKKYYRVMADIEREIRLKVEDRLQKGQTIPRSLLVNDGFAVSEEGIKRDEMRRHLIAEEARIAIAHREAISKIKTHNKSALQPVKVHIEKPKTHTTITPKNYPRFEEVCHTEKFDRALYFELLKSMSREDAWRKAKVSSQDAMLQKTQYRTGEFSYINTLSYCLQLRAAVENMSAFKVATNVKSAENYLRNIISNSTNNLIRRPKLRSDKNRGVLFSNAIKNVNFSVMRHFNLVEVNPCLRNISTRSSGQQADFKSRVLQNFYHRCAVTGQQVDALLQACHIEEYALGRNMSTDNGILLSADCHRLFDENMMGIDPEKLTVHFKVRCIYSSLFEGKRINPHRLPLNKEKLRKKWFFFTQKYGLNYVP